MKSCMHVYWWSVSHFHKSEKYWKCSKNWTKPKRFRCQMKAGLVFVMWLTLGPYEVSFTKDSRGFVTLLTQIVDWWCWCSCCKLLLCNTGILPTYCCAVTLVAKGFNPSVQYSDVCVRLTIRTLYIFVVIHFFMVTHFTFSEDNRKFSTLQRNCFSRHINVTTCNLFCKLFTGYCSKPE